jgi:hypothetical protein
MLDKTCHITIPQIDYPQVYADLMKTFKQVLSELGISVTESTAELRPHCLNVIFAPWGLLLPENESLFKQAESLAEYCALFNMEQPHPESRAFTEKMIGLMRRTFNFDYYPEHNSEFQRAGCAVSTVRFLWHPSMKFEVQDATERDIDILFIGSYTPRRIEAFTRIEQDFGLKVAIINDVWGRDIDPFVARSKIAINIRGNAENPSFEVLRCLPMIANGVVVVSENEYENMYAEMRNMVEFCDFAQIGQRCQELLKNPDLLETIRNQQYQALIQTSFLDEVQRGWSDWMHWLSEPLNRQVVGYYDQLNLSLTRPLKWRYDTLYLHHGFSNGVLDLQQPLSLADLERCMQSGSLNLRIAQGGFKQIETGESFARMVDPILHLRAWSDLLASEGKILLSLPYYLSPMAYDYPTYIRPCSEHSLKAFIGKESVYFLTENAYFDIENQSYTPTNYGASLLNNGVDFDIAVHTPNAISHVSFVLVKRIRQD